MGSVFSLQHTRTEETDVKKSKKLK